MKPVNPVIKINRAEKARVLYELTELTEFLHLSMVTAIKLTGDAVDRGLISTTADPIQNLNKIKCLLEGALITPSKDNISGKCKIKVTHKDFEVPRGIISCK